MKKYLSVTASLLIACLFAAVLPCPADVGIYDGVIRVHIVAASDDPADQELKLKVRDEVMAEARTLTRGCRTKEEARAIFAANLPLIEEKAARALEKCGSGQTVRALLSKEHYPTRESGGIRLPAGEYDSLRILIGGAEGANWWSLLYPSLALSLSSSSDTDGVPGSSQLRLIDGEPDALTEIKFGILELCARLAAHFKS